MRWGRRLAIAAAVVGSVACNSGSKSGGGGSGSGPGSAGAKLGPAPITGWEAGCAQAFKAAAGKPPLERYAHLAKACPVCGVEWKSVHDTMQLREAGTSTFVVADRREVTEVLAACGSVCKKSVVEAFRNALDEVDDPRGRNKPWRVFAKDCPDPVDKEGRYSSAPWYVLAQIGRAVTASPPKLKASTTVEIPLPAVGSTGRGLVLPKGANVAPGAPRVHVTLFATEVRVALAPVAQLGLGGLALDGAPDYPGPVVPAKQLVAAVERARAGSKQPPLLLAPVEGPATRVREVVALLDKQTPHLGVIGPAPEVGWDDIPVASAVGLRGTPTPGERVVIGLGASSLVLGHAKQPGATKDACTLAGDTSTALGAGFAWIAKNIVVDPGAEIVVAVGADVKVEALAKLVDELAGIRVATVVLVQESWPKWPSGLQACH